MDGFALQRRTADFIFRFRSSLYTFIRFVGNAATRGIALKAIQDSQAPTAQIKLSAGFTWQLWSEVGVVDAHVPLLRAQSCGVSTALSQTLEHRNDVSHDQGEVWSTLRSRTLTAQINEALCKVLCHNLCCVIQSVHELGIETSFEAALFN